MTDPPTSRLLTWRRVVGTAVLVALLAIVTHYCWTRLTVEPPLAVDEVFAPSTPRSARGPDDATDELARIADATSGPIVIATPAPPKGMRYEAPPNLAITAGSRAGLSPSYEADIADAVDGPWEPARRFGLSGVIQFLEQPAIREQIARLHALRDAPWQMDIWGRLGDEPEGLTFDQVGQLISLLEADARLQHAEHHDPLAAWQNLKTGLSLTRGATEDALIVPVLGAYWDLGLITELQHMTQECTLPPDLLADALRTLAQRRQAVACWPAAMDAERRILQSFIDATFTRDANGNGWMVLDRHYELDDRVYRRSDDGSVSRAWNLAAFVFNDRRTTEAKVERYLAPLRHASELPYRESLSLFEQRTQPPFNLLDGPLFRSIGRVAGGLQGLVLADAHVAATRIMLALQQYRNTHGEYPETLDALVPECLPALPDDPWCDRPFQYRRESPDHYVLYGCGRDGDDDLGHAKTEYFFDGDEVFPLPRPPAIGDPRLVPNRGFSNSGDPNESVSDEAEEPAP